MFRRVEHMKKAVNDAATSWGVVRYRRDECGIIKSVSLVCPLLQMTDPEPLPQSDLVSHGCGAQKAREMGRLILIKWHLIK